MVDFFELLNHSISASQFEARWGAWIEENWWGSNVWLKDMFGIRFSWCLAYIWEIVFSVGMSITERSEGMNNIVKMEIISHSALLEFFLILSLF